MTIEPAIGKEASREIVERGKMNFAFRMIDGGKSRLLLRPQRAGRVSRSSWMRPRPRTYWVAAGRRLATRAQAARGLWLIS